MDRKEPILDQEFYHVYNRGNRRQRVFRNDDDYMFFCRRLKEYSHRCRVLIHAWCLMPNHYHLILSQKVGGSIPAFMATLATSVTKRSNLKYRQVGHLFQGAYKYKRITSDEYLVHLSRYIHLNPVFAGLVTEPEDWLYSNYRQFSASLSLYDDHEIGVLEPILRLFENYHGYVEFVDQYKKMRLEEIQSGISGDS